MSNLPAEQPTVYIEPKTGMVDSTAFVKDYMSGKQALMDDMYGTEPGQGERKGAFDQAMGRSIQTGVKRGEEESRSASLRLAKHQARKIVEACRHGDKEALDTTWASVSSLDMAYNVMIQLALSLVVLTDEVDMELEQ